MKKLTKTILAALCISTVFAYVSSATIHNFTISLDSSQVVPPNASPGSGSGTATFDDATGTLSWQFSVSGLSGDVIDADFHTPATAGATAPKVVDAFAGYAGSAGTGTGSGSTTIYTPAAELLNNLWYLTVETNAYNSGDGEIRGQLIRVVAPPVVDHSAKIAKLEKKIKKFEDKEENARRRYLRDPSNLNFDYFSRVKKSARKKIKKFKLKIRKLKALG